MAKRINVDIGKTMKVTRKHFSKVGKEIMANKDLGTPLGLVHWKRASSPVEAGTAGYL